MSEASGTALSRLAAIQKHTAMVADYKREPYIPLAGCADDGWSKEDEATATCFCGAVQLAFVSLTFSSTFFLILFYLL